MAGILALLLLALSGCSKDAVDEQKHAQGVQGMNPTGTLPSNRAFPGTGYGAPGYGMPVPRQAYPGTGYAPPVSAPRAPGMAPYAGQYGQPYVPYQGQPAYPGNGWAASAPSRGWTGGNGGAYPGGAPVQGNPSGVGVPDWSHQGQGLDNPWSAGTRRGWQTPAWNAAPTWNSAPAPRYRPLDEDEKEQARRGSNPWVAPYDRPIGSSHSERPSPPTVPGLVSPEIMNPYGYGAYVPGPYAGLPLLGFYPGLPGVLGPWGW
ncbi:MAG: hypothetical protein D6721_05585 [Gammaproteobacteria bacterium]|nr:MAG: hypothetical protein D6721_05585 [Gammaproteobacteria bacterium]